MRIKYYVYTLLLFIMQYNATAQVQFTGGGLQLGMGTLNGAAASITSYHISPFIEFKQSIVSQSDMRLQFVYVRDLDAIIPSTNSSKYFPYVYGASLLVLQNIEVADPVWLQYGLGALTLYDKTYDDLNEWNAGFSVSTKLTYNTMHTGQGNGLALGIGIDYGQVFSVNSPAYFVYSLSASWKL